MPNHVINEVIFSDLSEKQIDSILEKVCNLQGDVDFEILVPAPINIWWGSTGKNHTDTFKDSHLDWATRNWGTKWNAYGQGGPENVSRGCNSLRLQFKTAWRPPYGWLVAIFNHFKVPFVCNWLSEGEERGHEAQFRYSKDDCRPGEQLWEERACGEAMQKHLHQLLWRCEKFEEDIA